MHPVDALLQSSGNSEQEQEKSIEGDGNQICAFGQGLGVPSGEGHEGAFKELKMTYILIWARLHRCTAL